MRWPWDATMEGRWPADPASSFPSVLSRVYKSKSGQGLAFILQQSNAQCLGCVDSEHTAADNTQKTSPTDHHPRPLQHRH